jgi:hypothetical protein
MSRQFSNLRMEHSGNETGNALVYAYFVSVQAMESAKLERDAKQKF